MVVHIYSYLKHHVWEVIVGVLLAVLSMGVMWPQWQQRYPSLIDDGIDLLQAKQQSYQDMLYSDLFEHQRTWPLRMVMRKTLYMLFETNVGWHFFVQTIVLFFTLVLVAIIVKRAKVHRSWMLITPLLMLVIPGVYGNFYRLGTGEPLQLLMLLIGLLFLERKRYKAAVLIFVANLLSKETSLFYSLPLFIDLLMQQQKKLLLAMSGLVTMFVLLLIYKQINISGPYVEQSGFDVNNIYLSLNPSSVTYQILVVNFVLLILTPLRERLRTILYLAYFATFAPLFIWPMNQQYYLYPNHVLGIICLTLSFDMTLQQVIRSIIWRAIFICAVSGYVLVKILLPSFWQSVYTANYWYQEYAIDGKLVEYLWQANLSEYEIYIDVPHFEHHDKVVLYLTAWPNRHNLNYKPLQSEWLAAAENQIELSNISDRVVIQFMESQSNKKILLTSRSLRGGGQFKVTPFCAQSIFRGTDCWFYAYSTQ